jgi:hypothetical protein
VRPAYLLILGVLAWAPRCAAQAPKDTTPAPRVWIYPSVREHLAQDWRADSAAYLRNERAYCLQYFTEKRHDGMDDLFVVGAVRAKETDVTPRSVTARCPAPGMLLLHTHPPHTCALVKDGKIACFPGGPGAYACQPSRMDEGTLRLRRDPVAFIQCDERALAPYFP